MRRKTVSFYWSCTVTHYSICVCSDIETWASDRSPEVKNMRKNSNHQRWIKSRINRVCLCWLCCWCVGGWRFRACFCCWCACSGCLCWWCGFFSLQQVPGLLLPVCGLGSMGGCLADWSYLVQNKWFSKAKYLFASMDIDGVEGDRNSVLKKLIYESMKFMNPVSFMKSILYNTFSSKNV